MAKKEGGGGKASGISTFIRGKKGERVLLSLRIRDNLVFLGDVGSPSRTSRKVIAKKAQGERSRKRATLYLSGGGGERRKRHYLKRELREENVFITR